MRLNREGDNPLNENIRFDNNIWSDPTGTMGSSGSGNNDFSDTPQGETQSFVLNNNLYWNGGGVIPADGSELVNFTDDAGRVIVNPLLGGQGGLILPRWQGDRFGGNFSSIKFVFADLVAKYGTPAAGSGALDAADSANSSPEDILGNVRSNPDIGALEVNPAVFPPENQRYLPLILR
jgi:hypothetical protein